MTLKMSSLLESVLILLKAPFHERSVASKTGPGLPCGADLCQVVCKEHVRVGISFLVKGALFVCTIFDLRADGTSSFKLLEHRKEPWRVVGILAGTRGEH